MDTTTGASQAYEEAAIIAEPGEVKPIHIFSPPRREIDEDHVAHLVDVLTRDGQFLNRIVVRAEEATRSRIIARSNSANTSIIWNSTLPMSGTVTPDRRSQIVAAIRDRDTQPERQRRGPFRPAPFSLTPFKP